MVGVSAVSAVAVAVILLDHLVEPSYILVASIFKTPAKDQTSAIHTW